MRRARRTKRSHTLAGDLLKGAAAGAVATWVMGRVTTYLYEHEDPAARRREDAARGGRTAYETAAEKTAATVDRELTDEERTRYGNAIHWGLGIGAGAVYAVLRRRVQPFGRGAGAAFGTAFWAVMDEGANTALGLTPSPGRFPWQAHARGLVGHLTFGTVTDATLRVLDAVV